MTPMVDVVMVILVFFMASAAFVGPEWYLAAQAVERSPKPAVTKADGGGSAQATPLVLRVLIRPAASASGGGAGQLARATLVYGGSKVNDIAVALSSGPAGGSPPLGAFAEAVKTLTGAAAPEQAVILADGDVSYEAVVAVREALARAGVSSVGVSQLKPEDEP